MISQISKALDKGFSEDQILDFIIKKFPKYASKISGAKLAGFNASQILNTFLGDKIKRENVQKPRTEYEETRTRDIQSQENRNQIAKKGLALGAATLAAPTALGALQRALPSSLQTLAPALLPSNTEQSQTPTSIETPQQPPVNQVPQSITETTNIQQPKVISNPKEYLEKKGVLQSVNESLKRGNNPEQVAVELGIKRSGNAKIDPELLQNIEEYAKIPQEQEVEKPSEPVKIEKNSLVNSPNGVGEVKEIRNGKAIIDVNGKLHKVKEEDLEASPLPEKDLAELYDELISGIESATGEDVSRMVQWAGYNPETNTLQFLPHSGKLYKYSNISPEDAELLTDILSTRKSSGSNFIGAWKAGSKSPIGAALSKLIKKLQSERGGKGNEYEETHEQIYSAYEPAIQAKKKKKK